MGLALSHMDPKIQNSAAFDFSNWRNFQLSEVESALNRWVACPTEPCTSSDLGAAMRYAVLGGGKRLRPLLTLAACNAVAGNPAAAMRAACAVELIHAYSLVHDDMPCMDNDTIRRGKPTVHVKFGEAQALLAGDALQALAFELLTPEDSTVDNATQSMLCRTLARAAGCAGMAGGQAFDLASVGLPLTSEQLHQMHSLKTGALLQASVNMGALCGQTPLPVLHALHEYGATVGLAFQVVDDVLDVTADSKTLGKTAGKDAAHDKPTFVTLMGLNAANVYAQQLLMRAQGILNVLHKHGLHNTQALHALANMLVNRQH